MHVMMKERRRTTLQGLFLKVSGTMLKLSSVKTSRECYINQSNSGIYSII